MNVLHLNTFDRHGGASIAAYRLHSALRGLGVNSTMGIRYQVTNDPTCVPLVNHYSDMVTSFVREIDAFLLRSYKRPPASNLFSHLLLPSGVHRRALARKADITHLHWLGFTFFPLYSLARLRGPVVWTTHDSWAFTGGCHFPRECKRYEQQCGKCPELDSDWEQDLSRRGWRRKSKVYARLQPVFVAPSAQFADTARSASLLRGARVEYIPNPVNTAVFRPIPRDVARQALGLPREGRVILFGALSATSDQRKGYDLLCQAIQSLPRAGHEDVSCLIFGASSGPQGDDLPLPVRFLGQLADEVSLALVYAAADVFVCPSRAESFSNTTVEALACGTPVVAFPVGGIPDMVDHLVDGYLAKPYDTMELAQGIAWVLEDPQRHAALRQAARRKIEEGFSFEIVGRRYLDLYRELLGENAK